MNVENDASGTPDSYHSDSTEHDVISEERCSPSSAVQCAQTAYAQGHYAEALLGVHDILNISPGDTAALLLAGACYFKLRAFAESLAFSYRAIAADSSFAEAYGNAGNALKELGDIRGAIALYQKAIQLRPAFADAHNNLAAAFVLVGDVSAAREMFSAAIRLNPRLGDAWANMGSINRSLGCPKEAHRCFSEAIRVQPMLLQAWLSLAVVARELGDPVAAVGVLRAATEFHATSPDVWMALGTGLRDLSRFSEATKALEQLVAISPASVLAHANLATCYYDMGDMAKAITAYSAALRVDPANPDCLNNLGNAFRESGKVDESIWCYKNALRINGTHPHAWNNLGNSMKDKGALREATGCYTKACTIMPDFAAAHSNLASVLKEQGFLEMAVTEYHEALRLDPSFADAWSNLGNAMKDLGRLDDAIKCYSTAVHHKPSFADAFCNLASAYKDSGKVSESMGCYRRALDLRPDAQDAFCNMVHSSMLICDWRQRKQNFQKLAAILMQQMAKLVGMREARAAMDPNASRQDVSQTELVPSAAAATLPAVQPFHSLVYPTSLKQMQLLAKCYAMKAAASAAFFNIPPFIHSLKRNPDGRIRVGYVSSDFGNHPLSHLMQSVFGMHNREQFEVFCYALSAEDGSIWRSKISVGVEHFIDVSAIPAVALAQRIHADGVHILINLNGYTKGAKNEVFALRPAPIQVNYMGFCGTLGADFVDYIVTDHTATPPGVERFYTEKVVCMPHSYFVNDHKQSALDVLDPSKLPTRKQFGIPAEKFVFANFNQIYKLDPLTFRTWCSILRRTPDSVLWLLRFPPAGEANIRNAARAFGIEGDRIIFTDVCPKDEHLKRGPLADLFLDTLVCNAHTTGCDILWGGVPMLTVPGEKMASRVAASLLFAAGIPECVCSDLVTYEEMAVFYATHPVEIASLRQKLENSRLSSPLFDTARWVRNFESGLKAMMTRLDAGLPAARIDVLDAEGSKSPRACSTVYLLEDCMSATAPADAHISAMDEAQTAITEDALRFPVVAGPLVLADPILLPPPVSLRTPPAQYSTADCRLPPGMLHTKQSCAWLHRSLPLMPPQAFPPVVPPGLQLSAATSVAPGLRWQFAPSPPSSHGGIGGHPLSVPPTFSPGASCFPPLSPVPNKGFVPTAVAGVVRYRAEQQLLQARKRHMCAEHRFTPPVLPLHNLPTSPPALQRSRHLVQACPTPFNPFRPQSSASSCSTYDWPLGVSSELYPTFVKRP